MVDEAAYLTTRQLAERVGVTPPTVREWIKRGLLVPAGWTPTGRPRFLPSQVEEALSGPPSLQGRAADVEAHVVASMARMRLLRRTS